MDVKYIDTSNRITFKNGEAQSFVGPKAVDAFRIATLKSAIRLLKVGITPTRGLTMTKALKMATEYTGAKYKRTETDKALNDLSAVLDKRKSECVLIKN